TGCARRSTTRSARNARRSSERRASRRSVRLALRARAILYSQTPRSRVVLRGWKSAPTNRQRITTCRARFPSSCTELRGPEFARIQALDLVAASETVAHRAVGSDGNRTCARAAQRSTQRREGEDEDIARRCG